MGQKTKGGMWCDYCKKPVMGVKNMHRVRNVMSAGTAVATGGLTMGLVKPVGMKVEAYVCPSCGNRVRAIRRHVQKQVAAPAQKDSLAPPAVLPSTGTKALVRDAANLALGASWWEGLATARVGGVWTKLGGQATYGSLQIAARAGLKQGLGPGRQQLGLYFRPTFAGLRLWIPFSAIRVVSLNQIATPRGPRSRLHVVDGSQRIFWFVAKDVMGFGAVFGPLLEKYQAELKRQQQLLATRAQARADQLHRLAQLLQALVRERQVEEDTARERQRHEADERRKRELLEEAQAIAAAVQSQSHVSIADELKKLAELRDVGILTHEEFEAQKARLLFSSWDVE